VIVSDIPEVIAGKIGDVIHRFNFSLVHNLLSRDRGG
jgi:hypothetical protein